MSIFNEGIESIQSPSRLMNYYTDYKAPRRIENVVQTPIQSIAEEGEQIEFDFEE